MNRSRLVLLTAWGLLAIGTVVQVLRPDGTANGVELDGAPVAELAYRDDHVTNGGEPASHRDDGAGGEPAVDGGTDAGVGSAVTADDPASWAEAGVVLADESFVATVRGEGVAATATPESGPISHWFPNPTQFGGDRVFQVVDQTSSPDHVKVSLPVMPNGQEGWIPRSAVEITKVRHRALIDLSDDSLTVWEGDEIIVQTRAVTGKPSTPTPVGTFYVRDVIRQPDVEGFYGPFILALSGFSEVLDSFDGGLPALAIHGTNKPGQIGSERSSGCIRIPNELIAILAETVPLGTPVTIAA